MSAVEFKTIVNYCVEKLKERAHHDPEYFTSCKTGDAFEVRVVEVLKDCLVELQIDAEIQHASGSHVFPDIVIAFPTGEKYGIEVKSLSSKNKGWKINGNSVLGSTRNEEVRETYVLLGKISKDYLDFRARKYEECISNVVVTHSPRYLIDMELEEGNTFFDKSGISYEEIICSDNPIRLITNYYLQEGMQAWWLSESTPAALRMFSDLSTLEKQQLIGYGLAHFPELFGDNPHKYKRFAFWLATDKSIITHNLRDLFSAGGQVNLEFNGHTYFNLPKKFKKLDDYKRYLISSLEESSFEDLLSDWDYDSVENITNKTKLDLWIGIASQFINRDTLDEITPNELLENILK